VLGVGFLASLRMVLMCPQLMELEVQQALDMAQLVGVLQVCCMFVSVFLCAFPSMRDCA
jgi:hypothetical protein